MDAQIAQGPADTDEQRLARAPSVLESYARDIERHGRPLDSGLPSTLRFVAEQLRKMKAAS